MNRGFMTILSSLVLAAFCAGSAPAQPVTGTRVVPVTATTSWTRAFTANSTYTTGFSAISAKSALATNITTGPVTSAAGGVLVFNRPAGNIVSLIIYGGGSDGQTINVRVWAWDQIVESGSVQWIPTCIWDGSATISSSTGVAGGILTNTDLFADAYTTTADRGLPPLGTRVIAASSADNGVAQLIFDPGTCNRIEVEMELGTASSLNALYKIGG